MAHTHVRLLYHIVFSTKARRPLLEPPLRDAMHQYLGGIIRALEGHPLIIGGVADHVHLLIQLPARLALADAVRVLKANSSKWARAECGASDFGWQEGYAGFSVSPSGIAKVVKYISTQEEHHRQLDLREELTVLLRCHNIEFDERFLVE